MQPRVLTITAITHYRGLTEGGVARFEVEFPGNWIRRARVDWDEDSLHMHRAAILDLIGEGFKVRMVRRATHGFVWEISVPRANDADHSYE